jgi:biopolymer transport protein ExbB/TolQ
MNAFTLREILMQGWPVLSILLIMSIISITTLLDRYLTLRAARGDARLFIRHVIRTLDERGPQQALAACERYTQPVAVVARAILTQAGGREAKERALQHALQGQIRELEHYVPLLGTVASTAPFVGLLGTVIGIIKAFGDIAGNVGGGPEVVASGIAEALITTACGLVVAIPALMGYNYLVHQIQRLTDEIDLAAYDLIERLCEPGH